MTLEEAKAKAMEQSKEYGGVTQNINFKVQAFVDDTTVTGFFYVSDWFDSDSTVKSYFNGKERG